MTATLFQNSTAEIIQELVIDLADGSNPLSQIDWPVYVSNEPSTPDDCITVYDTTGYEDGRSMIDGELWYHYGFQVRVRATDHKTGSVKAHQIRQDFAQQVYRTIVTVDQNQYLVHCIAKIGPVLAIGVDNPQTKRSVFTLNATLSVSVVPSTPTPPVNLGPHAGKSGVTCRLSNENWPVNGGINPQNVVSFPNFGLLDVVWVPLVWSTAEGCAQGTFNWVTSDTDINFWRNTTQKVIVYLMLYGDNNFAINKAGINMKTPLWIGGNEQYFDNGGLPPQNWQCSGDFKGPGCGAWKRFGPHTNFPRLRNDLNNDGNPDIVVANSTTNNISVLLGNGDGTYKAAVNYVVGGSPYTVCIGDLNGDGYQDLAVACHVTGANPGNLSILLGNGNGTFKAAVNYATGVDPSDLILGLFDESHNLSAATANTGSNTVSVLLGNGDGTFKAAVNYAVGNAPKGIALTHNHDLAVANSTSGTVTVLQGNNDSLGNNDGTFGLRTDYALGTNPVAIIAPDLDYGGNSWLVTVNDNNTVRTLPPLSAHTFSVPGNTYTVGTTPVDVVCFDFNKDGFPDLAVANQGSNNVSVLLGNHDTHGNPTGLFANAINYPTAASPTGIAAGNLTSSGNPDLMTCSSTLGTVSTLLGNGDGTFRSATNNTVGGTPLDVTFQNGYPSYWMYFQDSKGTTYVPKYWYPASAAPNGLSFFDSFIKPFLTAVANHVPAGQMLPLSQDPLIWYFHTPFGTNGNLIVQPNDGWWPSYFVHPDPWTPTAWTTYCNAMATHCQTVFLNNTWFINSDSFFHESISADQAGYAFPNPTAVTQWTQFTTQLPWGPMSSHYNLSWDTNYSNGHDASGRMFQMYKEVLAARPHVLAGTVRLGIGDDFPFVGGLGHFTVDQFVQAMENALTMPVEPGTGSVGLGGPTYASFLLVNENDIEASCPASNKFNPNPGTVTGLTCQQALTTARNQLYNPF